jgi:hypothetical protein
MSLKRIGFFSAVIIAIFIINSLIHSIYTLWQKRDLLDKAQQQLTQEKKQNHLLKRKLAMATQPQFGEEQARDKLFLGKPGEGVVLIPQQYEHASPSAAPLQKDTKPNWQQWWNVFF